MRSGLGVNLYGYFTAETGIGEAVRGMAHALEACRIPHALKNVRDQNSDRDRGIREFSKTSPYPTNIVHVNADEVPRFVAQHPEELAFRRNIGCWSWELSTFPSPWKESFHYFDEIWAPSAFAQQSITSEAPVPVQVMPHAVCVPSTFPCGMGRAYFQLPSEKFLFLFAFDYFSYLERKNPHAVLRAFQRAFGERRDVLLLIKTACSESHPVEHAKLRKACQRTANVRLWDKPLTRVEMHALLSTCDAYVSLHRAEGFGLILAEAMALGKPVVATGYSGNLQFMTGENSLLVGYRLVRLLRDFGPYAKGMVWAEPDIDEAADCMRRLVSQPQLCALLGERARKHVAQDLSPQNVGEKIRSRLSELVSRPPLSSVEEKLSLERLVAELQLSKDLTRSCSSSRRRFPGKPVSAAQKLLVRLLHPLLDRQTSHNSGVTRRLASLTKALDAQQQALSRLTASIREAETGAVDPTGPQGPSRPSTLLPAPS